MMRSAVLSAPRAAAAITVTAATAVTSINSTPSTCCGLLRPTATRLFNASDSTRRRNNADTMSSRPNDFDIDKEQWGKQMKFASLECVIDPNVAPINGYTFSGIRKIFKQWVSMKKLMERRPTFKVEDLMALYCEFKTAQNSLDTDRYRMLSRFTTFAEAERLTAEGTAELHARMKNSSWKTIASATQVRPTKAARTTTISGSGNKAAPKAADAAAAAAAAAAGTDTANSTDETQKKAATAGAAADAAAKPSASADAKPVLAKAACGPNIAGSPPYEVEIDKFEITNCFMGNMTSDDWIQITVRAEYREKNASVGALAQKQALPATASAAAAALRTSAMLGTGVDAQGFIKIVEFPVFEVKLGDGVLTANTQPFSVVAVLDRDGSRHGKDGNDASLLRKNFAQSNKSMFGFGR